MSRDETFKSLEKRGQGDTHGKGESHSSMLEHVIKRKVLDRVVRVMDMLVRVLKGTLNHKCRRVSSLRCRSVVTTGVAALRLNIGN